jgi:DNA-binding NarL/FixJ family response regulator
MNNRGDNPLRILVIAASPDRRASLAAIAHQAARARATVLPSLSLQRVFQIAPDALLVDVEEPSGASAALRAVRAVPAGTGFIVLVDNPEPQWVREAVASGINAILSRELTGEDLSLALQAAEAGLVLLHPSSAQLLARQGIFHDSDSAGPAETLTEREREVLRLVSEGLGNKEIAVQLAISDHTVKFHISSILSKLGAASRTEAVSQGIRKGFITI